MTLTPATFYDDNGVVRLQGRLDSSSGGSSPFQVLGPYTFAFNTPNLASDYVPLPGAPVLSVGTVVFAAYVFVTADWMSAGGRVTIGVATSPADFVQLWRLNGAAQAQPGDAGNNLGEAPGSAASGSNEGIYVGLPSTFPYVTMDSVAAQGSSDVYLIVYVP